jgi:hypothetical protein
MPLLYQQLSSRCEGAMCALPCIETMSTLATKTAGNVTRRQVSGRVSKKSALPRTGCVRTGPYVLLRWIRLCVRLHYGS